MFSAGSHDTTGHMAECSNVGVCDKTTGFCICRPGFTGSACERLTCPPYIAEGEENVDNICNGHGTCMSLRRAALFHGADTTDGTIGDGKGYVYTPWDRDIIRGCICSIGWTGPDCTLKHCPKNDDPLTTGQTDFVFTITTAATGGTLAGQWTFHFLGESTTFSALGDSLSNSDCGVAIMNLNNVETATCAVSSPTGQKGATHTITITAFPERPYEGNVHVNGGSPSLTQMGCTDERVSGGTGRSCTIAITTARTKEYTYCSNRGVCAPATGDCVCYANFYGPACHTRGVTQEIVDSASAMTISSTGDSYTGSVLELSAARGASDAFNFLKATASGSTVFTIAGNGKVTTVSGMEIEKGGATIAGGGLTLSEGQVQVYDDGANPIITGGAASAAFTSDILRLDTTSAASTNFNFINVRSDFNTNGGTTRFKVDGTGQVFISSTTESTSTTTGSFTTTGGVGIAKHLYVGQKIIASDTTVSTSSTTGSVIVAGGLGVAGNFYSGGGLVVEDGGAYFANSATGDVDVVTLTQTDASGFTGSLLRLEATQAAATTWKIIEAVSAVGGTPVDLFSVRGDGLVTTAGAVSIVTGGLSITAGGLTSGGGITAAAGGMAFSSTSAQAVTHTGANGGSADLTVSSTNGDVYIEGVKFSGQSITGAFSKVTQLNVATTLLSSNSGSHIYLNNATGFVVTLPACTPSTLGAFFDFYVVANSLDNVADQGGYRVRRSASDTITGGAQVISSVGSYYVAAADSAQQVVLDAFGKCAYRFATKTCISQQAATFGNVSNCLSNPCATPTDCPSPNYEFIETYTDSCTTTQQVFCVALNTKDLCTVAGDSGRDTAQVWTNAPGGTMGSRVHLECISDTVWSLSGQVLSLEATTLSEAQAVTGNA